MNLGKEAGRISAVGFDLGNTLMYYEGVPLNWREHYEPALREICVRLGLEADGERLKEACERLAEYNTRLHPRQTEIPAETIFADVMGCFGVGSAQAVDAAVDAFFGYFRQSYGIFDDALPFLNVLLERGIPAGILTDVPYGMPRLWVERDAQPFLPCVKAVLSSVDVGFRKPDAGGFLALARALGADAERMVFIGDEEKDVAGAKNAGMKAVLLDRRGDLPSFGEDLRVSSLMELL